MVAEDSVSSFLSAADEALCEEDDERNRKQAVRNRRIRGLLNRRKDELRPTEKVLGGFDEVDLIASSSTSKPVDGDSGENGEGTAPPPWLVLRDEASINVRLHEELLDFANFMKPSPPEVAARQAWAARIELAAKETLGESCKVHLFGSTSTGLCLPSADIDLTVAGVEGFRASTAMKCIAEWLLEKGEVSKIEIVQSARVPVAKLQQRSTGLWADVIINRLDGLDTSKFIREHLEIFPALEPLVLFLKLFLLQRGLHETFGGGLGSYLLVCLVLSYLQRHPSARSAQLHTKTTLGNLLFDLFRHYGQEFRYAVVGISLRNGGSLFDRAARGFTATTRTGQATLCLESPLEPDVDIGSRCFKIGIIRATFNHAYHTLSKLFLSKEAPGPSLLCPLLISQDHEVVANRYLLLKEQPPPLLDLPAIPDSDEEEEALESLVKRRRIDELAPEVGSKAMQPEINEQEEAAKARREFEMMMQPVDEDLLPPVMTTSIDMEQEDEISAMEELVAQDGFMAEPSLDLQPDQFTEISLGEMEDESIVEDQVLEAEAGFQPSAPPVHIEEVVTIKRSGVADDDDDLDEAGIFLEAIAEVEGKSMMGSPVNVGSPMGEIGSPLAEDMPLTEDMALAEEIPLAEDLLLAEDSLTNAVYAAEVGPDEVTEVLADEDEGLGFGEDFVAF